MEAREDLNLTQGQVGECIGTDQGTISKIERGKLLGPHFVSYLKFLGEKNVNLNKVVKNYEHKP